MVDEPVALRRKHRVGDGLVAVLDSESQCKIPIPKNQWNFHLRDVTRKEERR